MTSSWLYVIDMICSRWEYLPHKEHGFHVKAYNYVE